jgi:3-(3-hydroxy-phenyl)propionate hydroxylase
MTDFDVCIIGFGPTGAVAAARLADAGHKVAVVDRLTDVYDKPRAIALDHEIMRLFQNMGVIEDILPHVAEYPASEYRGVDGRIIKRLDAAPPPYPQGWAPNYSFTQPPVEKRLRDRAASAGATLLLGHELIALTEGSDHIEVELRDSDGAPVKLDARYVIGADGANSTVRRLSGLTLEDLDFDEPWLVVDVKVNEDALTRLPSVNVQYCEPARPATYVVGPGTHRRWEIMLNEDEDPTAAMEPERVWELLSRWVNPATATLWRSATYRFHAVVAPEWRKGNIILAGDAAHQQPPFLGQGMCQGLRDADNLAWKLDLVLRGLAPDTLLDSYGHERRDHVTRLISIIKTLGRFVCERDIEQACRRDEMLIADMGGGVVTTFRQDIMPKLETGFIASGANSGRGTLFPQPRIVDGKLLDQTLTPGFRLIVSRDAAKLPSIALGALPSITIARISDAKSQAFEEPEARLFVETENVASSWFERHNAVAALLRPDNYVYGTVSDITLVPTLLKECSVALSRA